MRNTVVGTGTFCPYCGTKLGAITEISAATPVPKPGDQLRCAHCLRIAIFTEELALRPLTDEERGRLWPEDPEQLKAAWDEMNRLRRRWTRR